MSQHLPPSIQSDYRNVYLLVDNLIHDLESGVRRNERYGPIHHDRQRCPGQTLVPSDPYCISICLQFAQATFVDCFCTHPNHWFVKARSHCRSFQLTLKQFDHHFHESWQLGKFCSSTFLTSFAVMFRGIMRVSLVYPRRAAWSMVQFAFRIKSSATASLSQIARSSSAVGIVV